MGGVDDRAGRIGAAVSVGLAGAIPIPANAATQHAAAEAVRSGIPEAAVRRTVSPEIWCSAATLPLLGLWADTLQVHALLLDGDQPLIASVTVTEGSYPALSPVRPGAAWFERAVQDLFGHRAIGGIDQRPWLDHGHWPHTRPMAPRPGPPAGTAEPPEFLPVPGDGHQLGFGPVAGDLGPAAHLRVTALGEKMLQMESRLGYGHRGMPLLMRGKSPRAAARFAARLAADATVAHALAFARAAETALGVAPPPRARVLRAVMGEIEHVAIHLADLRTIAAALGETRVALRCGHLRETLAQAVAAAFGHRLMMDLVVPGGVVADLAPGGAAAVAAALAEIGAALPGLCRRFDREARAGLALTGLGSISPDSAALFAASGVVGRASGQEFDARRLSPEDAPPGLRDAPARQFAGDAAARTEIRLREIAASLPMLAALFERLPEGPLTVALPGGSGEGLAAAESARGTVWHWLRLDAGLIAAAFARDPDWAHWPLLERAAAGHGLETLPLLRASFGCRAAGVDL